MTERQEALDRAIEQHRRDAAETSRAIEVQADRIERLATRSAAIDALIRGLGNRQ
jgi:hypothetical protein